MNVEFELSQEDVEKFKSEFQEAASLASADALKKLGTVAVEHLRSLDESLGHHFLASQWDQTDPVDDGDSVSVDVFSHVEEMTLFDAGWDAAGNRVHRDPRYPVSGQMLLQILEGGARAHLIFPRNASKLAVPMPTAADRTTEFQKKYGFIFNQAAPESDVAFTNEVLHPGILANSNVSNTADLLQAGMMEYAENLADEISVRLRE